MLFMLFLFVLVVGRAAIEVLIPYVALCQGALFAFCVVGDLLIMSGRFTTIVVGIIRFARFSASRF